jgi:tRNA nucleotidyltransferase/poly(A) polymerase
MKVPSAFEEFAAIYAEAGHELVLVGGAVRDLIQGRRARDLDFATDATPEEGARLLEAAGIEPRKIGAAYGTLSIERPNEPIEITTYRTDERYARGVRRPVVRFTRSLREDLRRRDLTVNAMALRVDGSRVDPFDGARDLREGRLRVPAEAGQEDTRAMESLAEDPLRILRILRYGAVLRGEPDPALDRALRTQAHHSSELPPERAAPEIEGLLLSEHPDHGLELMRRYDVLSHWMHELLPMIGCSQSGPWHHLDVWEHTLRVLCSAPASPLLRWAALAHDLGKPRARREGRHGRVHFHHHERKGAPPWRSLAERLRLPTKRMHDVLVLQRHHLDPRQAVVRGRVSDRALRRLVHRVPEALIDPLFELARADARAHHPDIVDEALADLDALEARRWELEAAGTMRPAFPKGFGLALARALAIEPGPELGRAMDRVREAVVEGELPTAAEPELCARWLTEADADARDADPRRNLP